MNRLAELEARVDNLYSRKAQLSWCEDSEDLDEQLEIAELELEQARRQQAKVTVVACVDGVLVRRHLGTAAQALELFDAVKNQLYFKWVLVRDRQTGGSWHQRARA